MFNFSTHSIFLLLLICLKYRKVVCKVIEDSEKFTYVRNTSVFIDKTFFLKKVLQYNRILITAPRKFGKTTNLQMVKLFLANHNEKEYAERFFENTNIWRDKQFLEKHFCKHPVIYFSLKPEVYSESITDIARELRRNIKKAYDEHSYLSKSSKLNKAAIQWYTAYVNLEVIDFSRGLQFLSEILYMHHGKKAVILIDDYDHLITRSVFSKLDLNKISRAVFHIINETINDNVCLERAIFMGTVPLKSRMNLLQSFKFMESKDFSSYFGFTESETEYLLDKFRLGRYKSEVSKWYGGYNYIKGTFQIYNPWSVLMFLKTRTFDTHWISSNVEQILLKYVKPHFKLHSHCRVLARNKSITYDVIPSFTFKEITKLKQLQSSYSRVKEDYDLFIQFFLESGYLTYAKSYRVVPGSVTVTLPNQEIFRVFDNIVKQLPVPDFSKRPTFRSSYK
ncbi:uncharacterized protein in vnfD 5'region-like [Macrosteles quadrilineatus]|uniref:uncharacterized protein in vnfD 5'region-like n=1 Tax=Macrosteles quadrilineatus TaxID=74068 RepID=UPI0023E2A6B4|nr:uncharacterized protein in vnfD 5'region-like [Macrosteles quadrilineatus]